VPWHVEKRGSKFAVVKGHTGQSGAVVATHPSRERALAQLRALYANADDAGRGARNLRAAHRKRK
jgi:predicted metal-dependent phosphoesterase TrpH